MSDRIMLRNPSPVLAALSTITKRHTPAREGGEPHLVIRRSDELEVTAYFGVGPNDHATYFVGIDDGAISVEAPMTGAFVSLEDYDRLYGDALCGERVNRLDVAPVVLGRPWHKGWSA